MSNGACILAPQFDLVTLQRSVQIFQMCAYTIVWLPGSCDFLIEIQANTAFHGSGRNAPVSNLTSTSAPILQMHLPPQHRRAWEKMPASPSIQSYFSSSTTKNNDGFATKEAHAALASSEATATSAWAVCTLHSRVFSPLIQQKARF